MKARVIVTLKTSVLDPQGQAAAGALRGLGFAGVVDVRQGKVFDIELDTTQIAGDPRAALTAMCERLLANLVIERYDIDIVSMD